MRFCAAFTAVYLATAAHVGPAAADFNAAVAAYAQGDFGSAFHEFLALANQRNVMAQDIVGMMYHRGNGVPKDDVQAYFWLDQAASAGDRDAAKFRDEMVVPKLTPSDLARAKELSRKSSLHEEGAPTPAAVTPQRGTESPTEPPASPPTEESTSSRPDQLPPSETEKSALSEPAASVDPVEAPSSPAAAPGPAAPVVAHNQASTQPAGKRRWTVQLISAQGKPEAERAWRHLRTKHPDLLRGLTPRVERAATDSPHPSYYRVRVGAWKDKQAPDLLCGKLKQRGERCLVLQRLS